MSGHDQSKEELLINFGNHLRALREAKGISSAELARRCLMDRGNYTRLESGQKDIQLSTLDRISQNLEISISELFEGFKSRQ